MALLAETLCVAQVTAAVSLRSHAAFSLIRFPSTDCSGIEP